MIRQYNVGFENSSFDRLAQSSIFKNGLYQKANTFWEYSVKKEYDAAECNLCFNELQHQVGKQISLSVTNDIIFCQPNVPCIWRNLLILTSVPWMFSDVFWSFSPKMSKQIVHPIYRVSQLNLLYRIILKKIAQYTALVLRNNHDTRHFSLRTYSVSYTVWKKMHFYFSPGQMNFIYACKCFSKNYGEVVLNFSNDIHIWSVNKLK